MRIQKIEASPRTITSDVPGSTVDKGGALSDVVVALGKTGVEIGDMMQKAASLHEKTKAENFRDTSFRDIQARAEQDPNPSTDNRKKYDDELKKAITDSSAMMTIPSERANFQQESSAKSAITGYDITRNFQKKNIELGKNELDIYLSGKENDFVQATNPLLKEAAIHERDVKIKEATDAGYISQGDAVKMKDDLEKKWNETQVKYDIQQDTSTQEKDSQILQELRNKGGAYSFLDPEARLKMIEESQRRIFQNNQTFKREVDLSQNKRNNDFIEKLANQTATFKDIDAEAQIPEEQGGMKRSVLLQYQKYLQGSVDKSLNEMIREKNPDTKESTRRAKLATEYNTLIETFLDDKTEQWKAKELLAKGLADGQLDAEELKVLIPIKDGLKDIKFNKDTSPVAYAIKKIKEFMGNSNASSEDTALRIKQMLGGISEGAKPQEEMTKIMDGEMLKHFPDHSNFPKEGKNYVDRRSGRAYKVFPDGKWAWIEGK